MVGTLVGRIVALLPWLGSELGHVRLDSTQLGFVSFVYGAGSGRERCAYVYEVGQRAMESRKPVIFVATKRNT